jgi:methionine-rich copper-binding protein CopC
VTGPGGASPDGQPVGRRLLLGGLVALLAPATAAAHATLVRAVPARRAVVSSAPPRVRLRFSEPLEPAFARVSVWNGQALQVDLKDPRVEPDEPAELSVGLPSLDPGTYTVKFRVLSVDGHVVEGDLTFTVRPRR